MILWSVYCLTGNQSSSFKTGVLCSLFCVWVTILAAVLWTSTMQVTLRLQPPGDPQTAANWQSGPGWGECVNYSYLSAWKGELVCLLGWTCYLKLSFCVLCRWASGCSRPGWCGKGSWPACWACLPCCSSSLLDWPPFPPSAPPSTGLSGDSYNPESASSPSFWQWPTWRPWGHPVGQKAVGGRCSAPSPFSLGSSLLWQCCSGSSWLCHPLADTWRRSVEAGRETVPTWTVFLWVLPCSQRGAVQHGKATWKRLQLVVVVVDFQEVLSTRR